MTNSDKYIGMVFSECGVLSDPALTEAVTKMRKLKNLVGVQ